MPNLIYTVLPPPVQTAFERLPLGVESPADVMTAIYVPPRVSGNAVNLLLWFHGHKDPSLAIDDYLAKPQYHIREWIWRRGAAVALVAPTMGAHSEPGRLLRDLGGYLGDVKQAMIDDLGFPSDIDWSAIVLACHSGGGVAMRAAADQLGGSVGECWGFDCLYNGDDPEHWAAWARSHPDSNLRVYYHSSTADHSIALRTTALRQNLSNVSVRESTSTAHDGRSDHENVPETEFPHALRAAYDTIGPLFSPL